MKSNNINFKQPKYIIPLLAFPFIIGIGYLLFDMLNKPKAKSNLEVTENLNPNLPDPANASKNLSDKFSAYKDAYSDMKDYSGIQNLEFSDSDSIASQTSIYTPDEIKQIEDAHQKAADEAKKLKELQSQYFDKQNESKDNRTGSPKGKQLDELEMYKKQLAYIDSLKKAANGETNTGGKNTNNNTKNKDNAGVDDKTIYEVKKFNNPNSIYFNTIKAGKNDTFITAIVDQAETVKDASRVRIRLLDDIFIGNETLEKGTYLYGLVSGFSAQRVFVNVTTILYNNQLLNCNLTVYDNDGIKGLYVPSSDFRELLQNAGGSIGQQTINMNQGTAEQSALEQFAYGALQDVYRATTQAVTKKIKQNKAKLKYDTVVYLINEKENKSK